jgi:hypothetical protein
MFDMVVSGPIAQRAISDAEEIIGVSEIYWSRTGEYTEAYLASTRAQPGDSWSAAFVSFRLQCAAQELKLRWPASFPISGYAPDYKAWALSNGLWICIDEFWRVQRGDLCCFWFAALERIAHVGIVSQIIDNEDRWFDSIEGNTSPDSAEVFSQDGEGVYCKQRRATMLGERGGFVRLPF